MVAIVNVIVLFARVLGGNRTAQKHLKVLSLPQQIGRVGMISRPFSFLSQRSATLSPSPTPCLGRVDIAITLARLRVASCLRCLAANPPRKLPSDSSSSPPRSHQSVPPPPLSPPAWLGWHAEEEELMLMLSLLSWLKRGCLLIKKPRLDQLTPWSKPP